MPAHEHGRQGLHRQGDKLGASACWRRLTNSTHPGVAANVAGADDLGHHVQLEHLLARTDTGREAGGPEIKCARATPGAGWG